MRPVISIRAILSAIMVALLTIVGSLLALVLRLLDSSGDRVVDLACWWSRWVMRSAGVTIVVESRAELLPEQPYVFMANHASSLDIWSLFVAIPRRVRMIAKKQLARIPLFGWAMWAGRFIFIDRKDPTKARQSIEEAGRRIHGGDSVLLFPEGTRTRDGQLGAFKKGGFHLAIQAGVPIVPVALVGTRALMPRGSLLVRAGQVRVILGQPVPTAGMTEENRDVLLERVRGQIVAMLDASRSP